MIFFKKFKWLLGPNRARPACTVYAQPAAAWPQRQTGLAGVAHMALAGRRTEAAHDDSTPTRGDSGACFMRGALAVAPLPAGEGCLADEMVLPVTTTGLQRPHTTRF
jgi:hypothetical protein